MIMIMIIKLRDHDLYVYTIDHVRAHARVYKNSPGGSPIARRVRRSGRYHGALQAGRTARAGASFVMRCMPPKSCLVAGSSGGGGSGRGARAARLRELSPLVKVAVAVRVAVPAVVAQHAVLPAVRAQRVALGVLQLRRQPPKVGVEDACGCRCVSADESG